MAEVSESDLGDVIARAAVGGPAVPSAGRVRLSSSDAIVDNVVVNPAAADAPAMVPVPVAGALLTSEEFGDSDLAGMTWVRQDPNVTVSGGNLVWPLENADLVGGGNNAGILLHDAPGDHLVASWTRSWPSGQHTHHPTNQWS